jgi:cephalosporin hydroxylase
VHDDRAEFAASQREHALALGRDADLVHRAFEVQVDASSHRFTYLWNWLGVPIIQMPTDIVVMQEIIWETKPTIIVETGVARGGSLIFSASMLQLIGDGIVVGVDIDIRAHNRQTIETHPLAHSIRLVQGSSVEPDVVAAVKRLVPNGARVMVILDSLHTHDHVLAELRAYSPLVTEGQFLVVADTGVGVKEAQRLHFDRWDATNNPMTAMQAFLKESDRFEPDPFYNGKLLLTSSPGGYLRCVKPQ